MNDNTFPKCKPQFSCKVKMRSDDFGIRYKALRNVSSHFISRPDVRKIIFRKCGFQCYLCGSKDKLQIDHVVSVYQGAVERIPYYRINSYENLMVICRRCNSAKVPIREDIWQDVQNKE